MPTKFFGSGIFFCGNNFKMAWSWAKPLFALGFVVAMWTLVASVVSSPDVENPNITCPSEQTLNAVGPMGALTLAQNVSAVDFVDGDLTDSVMCTDQSRNITVMWSGTEFPFGTSTVACSVVDGSSNSAMCMFNVTVNDIGSPTLSCHNMSVDLDIGERNATVYYLNVTATDESGPVEVICDPENGTVFDIGEFVVSCNATDPSGNVGFCEFNLAVNDVEPPTIDFCPENINVSTDRNQISVSWDLPNATDNYAPPGLFSTHEPLAQFRVGQTEVSYTFSDFSNNEAMCNFTVNVIDIGPPYFITCPELVEFVLLPGENEQYVNFARPIVRDNSAEELVPVSSPSVNLPMYLPYGETMYTFTATDGAGLKTTEPCVIRVVVKDEENPVISDCPESIFNLSAAMGLNTTNYTWTEPSARDNVNLTSFNSTLENNGTLPIGNNTVLYEAIDLAGNTAVCRFELHVLDLEPPYLKCPMDIVTGTDLGNDSKVVNFTLVDSRDNDGIVSTISSHMSGSAFGLGNTTVVFTVTDAAGNEANCSFVVSVSDEELPLVSGCQDITIATDLDQNFTTVDWPYVNFTDNVAVVNRTETSAESDMFYVGELRVNLTAEDAAGNIGRCTFLVTVLDQQAPSVIGCPAEAGNTTDTGLNSSVVYWQEPIITDNVGVAETNQSHTPGQAFPLGNTTVSYTAHDATGNTNANCSFVVTVEDNEPPELDCPSLVVANTTAAVNSTLVFWPEPTATDNVGGIRNESSHSSGDVFLVGNTSVTYNFTDGAGNENSCTFVVKVVDNEDPVIMNCPMSALNTTAPGLNSNIVSWVELTATDNVGIVVSNNTHSPGDVFSFGNTTVTYSYADGAGNTAECSFVVTVEDNEAPTITGCPGDIVNGTDPNLSTSVIYWKAPVIDDNVALASVTASHSSGAMFNFTNTTVTYTATDSSGNSNDCVFYVVVEDVEAPVIIACVDVTIETDAGQATSTQSWMLPMATDNVNVTSTNSSHQPGAVFPLGSTEVTYVVYDDAGLNDTCIFNLIVEDNEMPNITNCLMDVIVNASVFAPSAVYTFTTPTCTDNVGPVTITNSKFNDNTYPLGDTAVVIACFDESGNNALCQFTVTVVDVTPPQLMGCPGNQVAYADPGMNVSVNWTNPSVIDNSGAVTSGSNYNPLDEFTNGSYVITYTATDAEGNSDSCNFTLTVYPSDYQSPMIVSCPNDTIVPADLDTNATLIAWLSPVVTDNVGVTTLEVSHANGTLFYIGSETVVYTAFDMAGNTANCSFTVTVEDNQPPRLVNCSGDIVNFTAPNLNGLYLDINLPTVIENDNYTLNQDPYAGHLYTVGNTTVRFEVIDAAGLNDSCEFIVTIIDNIPPTFPSCPMNADIPTDPGAANASVTWMPPKAMDNVAVVNTTESSPPGTVVLLGDTLVVDYVAYDAAGLTAMCQFNLTVVDEEDPMIMNCPATVVTNTTVNASDASASWTPPTASDNSGEVTLTVTMSPGTVFGIGTNQVTYIAIDSAGNTAICMFDVVVQDVQDPVISMCPGDLYRFTYPGTSISVVWAPPMAQDNSGVFTMSSNYQPGDQFYNGTYTVTYTAVDEAGNTDDCIFTIQVNSSDTEPPMIYCPADVTLPADNGTDSILVTWLPPPYMDNNRVVSVNVTAQNGSLFYIGSEIVTYMAYDVLDNFDTCNFTVTILDTQDPVILNCPGDITKTTDVSLATASISWIEPTISDNSGSFNLDLSHLNGSAFTVGVTEVTYLVTDNSSNSAVCSFNVTVTDDERPVFDCPPDITNGTLLGQNVGTFSMPITVTDNVNVTYQNSSHQPGDMLAIGPTQVVYYAQDAAGNKEFCRFTVTIEDNEKPMILNCTSGVHANASLGSDMAYVTWPQPTAVDNSGMVTLTEDIPSDNMFPIGQTPVTYGAIDGLANVATCTTIVHVVDVEDPTVTCPPNVEAFADNGTTIRLNWTMPVAMDNSGIFTVDSSVPQNSEFPIATTDVTITVVDTAGNTANCTFSVIVYHNEAPDVVCPPDVTLVANQSRVYSWPAPTVTDNSGGYVNVTTNYPLGFEFPYGPTAVIITVEDESGNVATCNFTVTAIDDVLPVLVNCPNATITLSLYNTSINATANWVDPTASDNSGNVTLSQEYFSGDEFPFGLTEVEFVASDAAGNIATCGFNISVIDRSPPVILNCPGNQSMTSDDVMSLPTVSWPTVNATDNIEVASIIPTQAPGTSFGVGVTQVTYTATDTSGNTNVESCHFFVIVTDTAAPMFTSCPSDTTVSNDPGVGGAQVNWTVPTAIDNDNVPVLESTHMPLDNFTLGMTVVTYTAVDTAGNNATCSFTVTVNDVEGPIFVNCPINVTVEARPGDSMAMVTWDPLVVIDNSGEQITPTSDIRSGDSKAIGTHPVTFLALDSANNVGRCVFDVFVVEGDALMIACPAGVIRTTDPGLNSTVVSWPAPMYNSSMMTTLTSSHPVNGSFEVGVTTVQYTITGPDGRNASCVFTVTVNDQENPVISACPLDSVGTTSPGAANGSVFWIEPTADDNVGVVNFTSNYKPSDLFPVGTTEVIYEAVDAAGNVETCMFNAIVNDNEAPVFTFCPMNMNFNTHVNGAIVVPAIGMPNVTDNIGVTSLTSDYNLTTLAVGSSTLVTFTVLDAAGNAETCAFNITIIDAAPPVISGCPGDMVIPTDAGLPTALANWTKPTATDNDVVSFDPDVDLLVPLGIGRHEITYVATDAEGLTADCKFNVTVEDRENPVISACPLDSVGTNSPGVANGSVFWIEPTADDNVGVVNFTSNYKPSDLFPVGTTEVIYEAVDAAGNVETCMFNAIVNDNEAPVFTFCPDSSTIPTGANGTYVVPTWPMPNATDNAGPLTITNDYNGQPLMVGTTTTITFTVTDDFGNLDTCSFNIAITDGTPPQISGCPGSVTANARGLATGQANWTAPTSDDNVAVVALNSDYNSGDMFDIGTTLVTYTATDAVGLTAVCQFNITVEDTEAPVLMNCPMNLLGSTNPGRPNASVSWPNPTALDNSLSDIILDSNYSPGDVFPIGETTVTFVATDPSGNSVNCSFVVDVMDYEVPVFTTCPGDLTLNLENVGDLSVIPTWDIPVATDNAGPPTVTTDYSGGAFAVNTTTVVTYTATDSSGNPATCSFSVTIADAVAPRITNCPVSFVVNTTAGQATGEASWPVPTASDDQEVVSFVASHTPPLTLSVGALVVNYTATDNQGFVSVCEFTITVQDAEDPVISGCPRNTVTTLAPGQATASPFWIAPTATDNVGVESLVSNADPGDPMGAGTFAVFYTATDAAGNMAICSFNVIVHDNEAPVFTFCPASLEFPTSSNGSFAVPSWQAPNATDNSGQTSITSDHDGQPLVLGSTMLITYTVADSSGNTDTCSFNVTIIDGTPPTILNCPDNFTVSSGVSQSSGQANWTEPTAEDNAQVVSFTSDLNSGDFFPLGTREVTYTAVDSAGLTTECVFTVTVEDTVKPVITGCPGDIAVNASTAQVIDWTPPAATDNVAVVNQTATHQPNTTFALGSQTTVTYRFEDEAGNFEECSFVVTIYNATATEDLSPMFVSCPSDQVVPTESGRYNASVSWSVPMATDRESTPSVVGTRNPGDVFSVGNTSVTYTATDSQDQTDTCVFFITVQDEENPVISNCPPRIDVVKAPANATIAQSWTPPDVTDNSGVVTLTSNIEPGAMFAAGETDVIYTAMDAAGNTETCTFSVNVTGDVAPYFVTCLSNIVTNTTTNEAFATVVWAVPTAEDDVSTPIVIEVNGYNPGRQFTMGTWTVEYVATDSAQQTATCEFNITVVDRQDPVIEGCPADISEVTLDNALLTVTWIPPVATDNSGEYTLIANDNHSPGEMLAVGSYDVIYTVRDPSGNEATCEFTILIENSRSPFYTSTVSTESSVTGDDAPPVFLSCPPSSTVATDPGQNYATVSFSFPSPSDDRSNPSLVGSHAPGTQFPIGDTTVTYTAYDSAGQSAECVFVITVEDRGDPVIMNCPSDQTVRILSTGDEAAVYWTPPVANDSSALTLSSNKNPGDLFGSGSTQVTYTAVDAAGNVVECSFSVLLLETIPTYETDGSVELVQIASTPTPFSSNILITSQDVLRSDLDKLFRRSSLSSDFVGISLTSTTVGNSDQAVIEFLISFTGTPAPNDTEISAVFSDALGPAANEFETGNVVSPGTFMLSLTSCQTIPCENGGSCVPDGNSFVCMCTPFWTGDYCETDVNECVENNPCANDRVCINLQGSYLCGCPAGFFLVGDSCIPTSDFSGSFAITRIGGSEVVFSADLEDPRSERYLRVAGDVTSVLDDIFVDESSYIASRIIGMSNGSIMIRYVLLFSEDTDMNEDRVTQQMSNSISADGEIAGSALFIRPSSLTYANHICPDGYCKNGGTCSPDPVTYESTCRCESPYSGDRCEIADVWSPLVIAMVAVAGVLLVVLVGLFISCCCFLRKRLNEEPKYPGMQDLEQRKTFVKMSHLAPRHRPSAVDPPRNPRGRSISTSFASHASQMDAGSGIYRQNDNNSDMGTTSYQNNAFDIPYLEDEEQSTRQQDLARQLQQIAIENGSLDYQSMDLPTLANDTPQPDYDTNEVFPVYDPIPHMDHRRDHLQVQRVGYADDMVPDYPQSSTFMRPYVASGQEALGHYYSDAAEQQRLGDNYRYF